MVEFQMTCPHCGKTISNDTMIDTEGNEAGLVSTSVFYQCVEKITFSAFIAQPMYQKDRPQHSSIGLTNTSWLEEW
jgi:hypothetical protein